MRFKATQIDITPNFPSRLTGMKVDERQQGVRSSLEMNSLVFCEGEKHTILISIDTLFISHEVKAHALKQIQLVFKGIQEENLILLATHTHFAPSLEMKRVGLGACDVEYLNFLKEKIEVLITQLASEAYQDIEVEVGSWKTKQLTCNRRRYVRSLSSYLRPFVSMEPNLNGFKNEEFKVIKVFNAKDAGKMLSVIWSFPCHPTNLSNSKLLSAEFPGEIRKMVREIQKDANMPVFYFPGFAGDVRAFPPKRFSISKLFRTS